MSEDDTAATTPADEIEELKRQMALMQERLARLSAAACDGDASQDVPECDDGHRVGDEPAFAEGERADAAAAPSHSPRASAFAGEQAAPSDAAAPASVDDGSDDGAYAAAASVAAPGMSAASGDSAHSADAQVPTSPVAASAAPGASPQGSGEPSYTPYVPPASATPGVSAPSPASAQRTYAGQARARAAGPTPPPSYGAANHFARQQAAPSGSFGTQAAAGHYAQPTGQQSYQQGGYGAPQSPYAPYGQHYYQQPVVRTKDHVAAGLLGIFLGAFGIHKFYLGYNTAGFIMLGVALLGGLLSLGLATSVVWLIGLIEGIIYLVKGQSDFEQVYVFGKREWF